MKIENLMDTVGLMTSLDYKERFIAEYWQTRLRQEALHQIIVKDEAGTLRFTPLCRLELLKKQESCMRQYLECLEIRAEIEGIDLEHARIDPTWKPPVEEEVEA